MLLSYLLRSGACPASLLLGAMSMDFARLEKIILSVCIEAGYELVEIDIAKSKSGDKLTIYIDNLGKITIDDCVKVNNLIEQKTEIDSFFANEYTLEVSSPGPKRPLKKIEDFYRYKGRKIKIISSSFYEDKKNIFIGEIEDIENNFIKINDSGKLYKIDFSDIEKANLNI